MLQQFSLEPFKKEIFLKHDKTSFSGVLNYILQRIRRPEFTIGNVNYCAKIRRGSWWLMNVSELLLPSRTALLQMAGLLGRLVCGGKVCHQLHLLLLLALSHLL